MKKFLLSIIFFVMLSGLAYSATTWYIPEGCTRGFDLWILVTNTNSTAANITYTFYTANNGTLTHTETVNANARLSIYANAKINAAAGTTIEDDVSTKVECTNGLNIYAERAMYWPSVGAAGGVSGAWTGGHSARAISGLEGCYTEITQPSSFPITISQSGSYKLISNITSTDIANHIIKITASNVTLDLNGFTLDGPDSTNANGIQVEGSAALHNIKIKNGIIQDCGSGIVITSVNNFMISDIITYSSVNGFVLTSSQAGIVEKCMGSANENGILLTSSSYNTVRENTFYNNSSDGIGIRGGSTYNRIEGNHCMYTSAGVGADITILATGNHNLVIANSVQTAATDAGANNVVGNSTGNTAADNVAVNPDI